MQIKHEASSSIKTYSNQKSKLTQEEQEQLNVIQKVDNLYDIDDDGIIMYVKGSLLTDTIGKALEEAIKKIETLEQKIIELENKLLEKGDE